MRTASDTNGRAADPAVIRLDEPSPDEASQLDLTIGEAAALYDISRSSLRRKLKAKKIPGSYQVPGSDADVWRIPQSSLDKLGIRRKAQEPTPEVERTSPAPEIGVLSGYFITAIEQERARRLEIEIEKAEAEARSAGATARSQKLLDELLNQRRELITAQRSRAAAEREREAAFIEAHRVASRLKEERRRRHEAEAAAPTRAETFVARLGWSFFGVVATLCALILVGSLLLDTLLFDGGLIGPTPEERAGSSAEGATGSEGMVDSTPVALADAGVTVSSGGDSTQSVNGSARLRSSETGARGARSGQKQGSSAPLGATPGSGSTVGGNGDSSGSDHGATGSSGSGSGDGAADGSGGGNGVGGGLGDAVGDTVGGAAECVCGAVSGAAGAAGAAARDAAGAAGDAVEGAAEAAAGATGAVGEPVDDAADAADDVVGDPVGEGDGGAGIPSGAVTGVGVLAGPAVRRRRRRIRVRRPRRH